MSEASTEMKYLKVNVDGILKEFKRDDVKHLYIPEVRINHEYTTELEEDYVEIWNAGFLSSAERLVSIEEEGAGCQCDIDENYTLFVVCQYRTSGDVVFLKDVGTDDGYDSFNIKKLFKEDSCILEEEKLNFARQLFIKRNCKLTSYGRIMTPYIIGVLFEGDEPSDGIDELETKPTHSFA